MIAWMLGFLTVMIFAQPTFCYTLHVLLLFSSILLPDTIIASSIRVTRIRCLIESRVG